MKEKLHTAAEELLPAIAYGDAAGVPTEGKSTAEIQEVYGEITELREPVAHPFFPYEGRGVTSDDTQLSVVAAESLVAAGGFSLEALRDAHIEAYNQTPLVPRKNGKPTPRRWGGSTTEAVERMMSGVSPLESGQKNGGGNGVVMKMAPLALWHALREVDQQTRQEQYDLFTTMTHDTDIARVCTRLHGEVISALLKDDIPFDEVVRRAAHDMREDFPRESELLLRAIDSPCQDAASLVERYAAGKSGKRYGFYVPETLAIAYDIFLGSEGDMQTAVYRAVNLGGDSDSTASIVAAMAVCQSGGVYDKPHDIGAVQDIDHLYATSAKLAAAALKG